MSPPPSISNDDIDRSGTQPVPVVVVTSRWLRSNAPVRSSSATTARAASATSWWADFPA